MVYFFYNENITDLASDVYIDLKTMQSNLLRIQLYSSFLTTDYLWLKCICQQIIQIWSSKLIFSKTILWLQKTSAVRIKTGPAVNWRASIWRIITGFLAASLIKDVTASEYVSLKILNTMIGWTPNWGKSLIVESERAQRALL